MARFDGENYDNRGKPGDVEHDAPRTNATNFPLVIANMTVSDSSPVPLYEQICRTLRTAISVGDLPPGTPLPTSRELADALKIGRNTVVTAYSRLGAEGYLHTNKRRGTRVADRSLGQPRSRREENNRADAPVDTSAPRERSSWPNAERIEISYRAKQILDNSAADSAPTAPFALHAPDPSLYPRNPLSRLLAEEFCRSPAGGDFQLGTRKFQSAMAHYLRHMRGVDCDPGQIIPITSLESALDLTARVMIDPGHHVYIENPANDAVRNSFRSAGAQFVSMPSDNSGADIAAVAGPPPRLIVTAPSVGFPFGQQMSETRRAALLDAARNWNCAIFECDSMWELSYTGSRLRALQGREPDAPILYFGSLSETLGPHIRLGYLIVPPKLVEPFRAIAQQISSGPEPFVLGALASFIENSDYAVHTKMIRAVYADRLRTLIENIRALIPNVTVREPSGGLHLTILFDNGLNDQAVCRAASERGMSVAPLSRFYDSAKSPRERGLVLGFGTVPERAIETMVQRLAEVIVEVRERNIAA